MDARLLGSLLKSVRSVFWRDATAPGIVLSQLGTSSYYASIVRYTPTPTDKVVVVSAKGDSDAQALEGLALAWIAHNRCTTRLRKALGIDGKRLAVKLRAAFPS